MLLSELRELLKKYSRDELMRLVAEMYEAMPGKFRKERDIEAIIRDIDACSHVSRAGKVQDMLINDDDRKQRFKVIKNGYGMELERFEFDYLGGHPGMDEVILNGLVRLYEKGLDISSVLSSDHIFMKWDDITSITSTKNTRALIEITCTGGKARLQRIKKEINLNKFKEIIMSAAPYIEFGYIDTGYDNIRSIEDRLLKKHSDEQERRIRQFIASCGAEGEVEILEAWKVRLDREIEFPFDAKVFVETKPFLSKKTVKVIRLDYVEDSYGIIAVIKCGSSSQRIPLCELVPVDKEGKVYQLVDDYCDWFFSN